MIKTYNDTSGILLVDKPAGITSFKIVSYIRHKLKVKKAGHSGTLDPLATGLLIVLVGKATKQQSAFMKKDKVYKASARLGVTTDTGDSDGAIISEREVNVTLLQIKQAAQKFIGVIEQIPPMYSAIKQNGKRLYELARAGITVERQPRRVTINRLDILSFDGKTFEMRAGCSSGTYIRTLAQDLGNELGTGATITALRRESIDVFSVDDAVTFDKVQTLNSQELAKKVISI
jgi:tRNA pseudouridine55 synthase